MLPSFELLLERYVSLITHEMERIGKDFRFEPDDLRHLIEAHALSVEAIEKKTFLETSGWSRQTGASAVALVLLAGHPGVHIINSSLHAKKAMTRRLCDVFHEERAFAMNRYEAYGHPTFSHTRLWSISIFRNDMLCQRPDLIIVDSDTMWVRDALDEVKNVQDILKCGVVVFKSKSR